MKRILWTLAAILSLSAACFGQGPAGNGLGQGAGNSGGDDNEGPLQTGYAIVTTVAGTAKDLVVFETFGLNRGNETTQAGLLASDMCSSVMLFVNANGKFSKNLGVAIANPSENLVNVTLTLRDEQGTVLATKTFGIPARAQVARFVTEMFSSQKDIPEDLTGTLLVGSSAPVGIIGLRFRGENFSTLPITSLSSPSPVPLRESSVGGPGAVLLPHYAAGGGWATELVLTNAGAGELKVRVDLYKQDGSSLKVRLNGGEAESSYVNLVVPKGGVLILSPRDSHGHSPF